MSLIECGAPGTNRVVCVTGQICDEKVKNTLKIVINLLFNKKNYENYGRRHLKPFIVGHPVCEILS